MGKTSTTNKSKIFNDPIYGFISVPNDLAFKIIEHPYFQRLRRIKQLGLTNLVYPGALHTRFHHAMGAMHLMNEAIDVLKLKGIDITNDEKQAAICAILLHDIGHGPFSHALEHSIVSEVNHEKLSELFMDRLRTSFDFDLYTAINIFKNTHKKKFLHQLVSSQLDVDRMDYLMRDSFYTGVSEGIISSERIIKMLNVVKGELVVESKGIYSVEKFLMSRRLMYWQVYLHKTVIAAENMLVKILKRAKELAGKKIDMFATPAFRTFLYNNYTLKDFKYDENLLGKFAELDDNDIMASVKVWTNHPDKILSTLCKNLLNRKLYKTELQNKPFGDAHVRINRDKILRKMKISEADTHYFVFTDEVASDIYNIDKVRINILQKDGSISDIAEASDHLSMDVLGKTIKKYYLCYPKD